VNLMPETLSSAELAVLAAALGSNASPWIEDSALLALDRPILAQRLAAAREGLELREIAEAGPDGGLRLLPPHDGLLRDALSATIGFEMQIARADAPAERLQVGMTGAGGVAHRWLAGDDHLFCRLAGPAEIADEVMKLGAAGLPPPAAAREYRIPHAVMTALAREPAEPEPALRTMLTGAGVSPQDVEALLRAGLTPASQCVFWSIGLRGAQVQARALMWFADATSGWMITNFDDGGQVTLQTAGEAEVRRAVDAVIAAATQAASSGSGGN
jgi:hypothetical protein